MSTIHHFQRFMNYLPKQTPNILSSILKPLAYTFHERSKHRRQIHQAMASALDLPLHESNVDQLVKAHFKHLLQVVFEIIRFDQLKKEWSKTVQISGMEHYHQIRKQGQGVVLFSGHIGNWELLISSLSLIGFEKPHALGWKQPPSEANDLLDRQRVRWGTRIFWAQEFNEEEIGEVLSNGGTLFVLSDRYEQAKTKVQLFGQPIGTPAGPVLFARKYNAALLPIHTYRDGSKHQIVVEPPLKLDPLPLSADLTPDLQLCVNQIEGWIRQHPEQWAWIFKRGEWTLES